MVCVSHDGRVVLVEIVTEADRQRATFESSTEAIRAIEADAIPWRLQKPQPKKRWPAGKQRRVAT